MEKTQAKLTQGSVGRTLLRLTGPMYAGILSMMLFNIVDTWFVGKLGARALAAMGYTFPVVFMVTGTAMGMGIGLSSVVSRAIGQGDQDRVVRLTSDGLLLAGCVVLVFVGFGLGFMDRIFLLLGAPVDLLPLIRSYMVTLFCGIGFLVVPMVGNSAIRATGDTLTPSLIMIIAGITNVILDPLLIFGWGPFPRLELQGAALATVLAYAITFVAALYILAYRERILQFGNPGWTLLVRSWKSILYISVPAIGTNLLLPIAVGVLTRILSGFGTEVVAAYGVGSRIESLTMAACFALSTAMAPFAGQNLGANRCDRVRSGIGFAIRFCVIVTAVEWVLLLVFAHPIAAAFSDNPVIIENVKRYIYIVPLSYGAFGFMLQVSAVFNSANEPLRSVILFTTRLFVLTVPLAVLGAKWGGVSGVFMAIFIGNALAGVLAVYMVWKYISSREQTEQRG